jgi:hypothetical protein
MWRPGKLRFLIGVKNPLPIGRPRPPENTSLGVTTAIMGNSLRGAAEPGVKIRGMASGTASGNCGKSATDRDGRGVAIIVMGEVRPRKSGSHQTPRWREQDSNHRSPVRRAAVLSLPPSPAEAVAVVAEVMVPAEITAMKPKPLSTLNHFTVH